MITEAGQDKLAALEADRQNVPVILMGDPGQMKEITDGTRLCILKPFAIAELRVLRHTPTIANARSGEQAE